MKTIIALKGIGGQGKSSTIKLLRDYIKNYHSVNETILIDNGDIKTLLEVNGIKIGIESQGDPKSRQANSILEFISINCDIIICTSRTSGETETNILNTVNHGYRIIWVTNYRSKQVAHSSLNDLSAKHLLDLFNQVISSLKMR